MWSRRPIRNRRDRSNANCSRKPRPSRDFVEIDRTRVRVENCRQFGGPWLALELVKRLGLHEFLQRTLPVGQEHVPWSLTALILVIARLCEPSSELHIAEHFYRQSALCDLLGVPVDKVDDNRLYRGLDELLPHKEALEVFLKQRFGELFAIEYDLLLYDVTSTYFEGQAKANPLAQARLLARSSSRLQAGLHRPGGDALRLAAGLRSLRGKSARFDHLGRDRRDDGSPLWPGAAHLGVGSRHGLGREPRVPESRRQRQYIVGTPKSQLKRFEQQLAAQDWHAIREGLEVKLCPCPDGGTETYILCRSRDRREKEQAMHARFEKRIEEGLTKIAAGCVKRRQDVATISRRVGRLLGQNTRAAGLFDVQVRAAENGAATDRMEKGRDVARLGPAQRRLLRAAHQRERLERRRPVAGLHPIDRRGDGVPHPEERLVAPPGVASKRGPRAGAHPGLLSGLRALEVPGPTLPEGRPRQRTATRAGRTQRTPRGRRRSADERRPRDPHALRHPAQRPPEESSSNDSAWNCPAACTQHDL